MMPVARLITPLDETEKLCLSCPLPECDEDDPRCPYQQARGRLRPRSKWQWLYDALDGIEPGETWLVPLDGARVTRIQNHLYNYVVPPAGHKFATRREGDMLAVWLKGAT